MKSFLSVFFTARKQNLGQGNIFSSVCQEFCSRGGGLPQCMLGYPPSKHPTRAGTHQEQTPPPPCTVHAGRYGQQVGGMHPTGMQSCLLKLSRLKGEFLKLRIHKPGGGWLGPCAVRCKSNKFEVDWRAGLCSVRSKLNKFEHV